MTRYVKARAGWYWHIRAKGRVRKGAALTVCGLRLASGYAAKAEQPTLSRWPHDYGANTLCMTCSKRLARVRK